MSRIAFNPSTSFIPGLWHSDLFWTLPDTPSGVSIFVCPEIKSLNTSKLEKEKSFVLADKVKAEELSKVTKQKMYLPTNIMDLVWITQNLHVVISLVFGPQSHSASFPHSWASHMYDNRLIYSSLYSSDSGFYVKVLFAIDSALQIHWRSCCNQEDRMSVNDKVLFMQEQQDMLLCHNVMQQLPKPIMDKNQDSNEKNGPNQGGKHNGKLKQGNQKDGGKEMIHDPYKSHLCWRIQDGEDFSKIFYRNQRKSPKMKEGKMICMKLFH